MTIVLNAGNLLEHMKLICDRPLMYAPDFTLAHLFMFVQGYEMALRDKNLPSQHDRFCEWLYKQRPEWRQSSLWWGNQVLKECEGQVDLTLDSIIILIDGFLSSEGAKLAHSPIGRSQEP